MRDKNLPSLDHMRTVLRIGMTKTEFYQMCDDLMDTYTLKLELPMIGRDIVTICVMEGDGLMCFLSNEILSYIEYKGDIFME